MSYDHFFAGLDGHGDQLEMILLFEFLWIGFGFSIPSCTADTSWDCPC